MLSVTAVISYLWKLDLAWNLITPIIPLTLGAVTGTLMVFRLSVWIRNASTMFSNIFTKVGRETYVVVAFSQVTVMCINYLFTLNPLLKYAILVIVLILLKYLKDGINRLVRIKIL